MNAVQCDYCFEWCDEEDTITDTLIQEDIALLSHLFFCSVVCMERFKKECQVFYEK